jgi:hypothetical protein
LILGDDKLIYPYGHTYLRLYKAEVPPRPPLQPIGGAPWRRITLPELTLLFAISRFAITHLKTVTGQSAYTVSLKPLMPRRVVASGRSCLECRRRKIKCDRSLPCAYCTRTRIECTYPPKPTDREAVSSDDPLLARVERLEGILQSLQSDLAPVRHRLPISSNNCQEHQGDHVGSVSLLYTLAGLKPAH